jgi:hypothetical protein
MYQVRRNNRVMFKGQVFESYERARQAIRKYIRRKVEKIDYLFTNGGGWWDGISRNPSRYTNLGFEVKKVA